MRHRDYVAERERRDPAFRSAREQNRRVAEDDEPWVRRTVVIGERWMIVEDEDGEIIAHPANVGSGDSEILLYVRASGDDPDADWEEQISRLTRWLNIIAPDGVIPEPPRRDG